MTQIWYPISTSPSTFSGGSDGKASACSAGDLGSIPGSGRSPGEGNGNPRQYSCLENPMDAGAWWGYSPWGRKESDTTEQLYFHFSLAVIFIISCMIALRSESIMIVWKPLANSIAISKVLPRSAEGLAVRESLHAIARHREERN